MQPSTHCCPGQRRVISLRIIEKYSWVIQPSTHCPGQRRVISLRIIGKYSWVTTYTLPRTAQSHQSKNHRKIFMSDATIYSTHCYVIMNMHSTHPWYSSTHLDWATVHSSRIHILYSSTHLDWATVHSSLIYSSTHLDWTTLIPDIAPLIPDIAPLILIGLH